MTRAGEMVRLFCVGYLNSNVAANLIIAHLNLFTLLLLGQGRSVTLWQGQQCAYLDRMRGMENVVLGMTIAAW